MQLGTKKNLKKINDKKKLKIKNYFVIIFSLL